MNRRQRTELFIEYGQEACMSQAAELLTLYDIETMVNPQLGLMMIKQRETAQNTLFYSGEVLVTECKVRCGQVMGLGLIKGNQAEMARALAVLDLAFNAGWPECQALEAWLQDLARVKETKQAETIRRYQQSRVDFSTMQQ